MAAVSVTSRAWDGGDWRWLACCMLVNATLASATPSFTSASEMAAEINPRCGRLRLHEYVYLYRNTKLNKNIVVGFVDNLSRLRKNISSWWKTRSRPGATPAHPMRELYAAYAMLSFFTINTQQFKLAYNNGVLGLDIDGRTSLKYAGNLYVMNRLVVGRKDRCLNSCRSTVQALAPEQRPCAGILTIGRSCMDNAEHFNQVHEMSERKWFIFRNFYTGIAHLLFPDKVFEPALKFLEEAELKAKGEPDAAQRVAFIRQGYEHARLCAQSSAIFANQNNDNLVRQRVLQVVKDFREQIPALAADLKRFTRGGVLEAHAWKLLDMSLENSTALPETWKLKIAGSTEGRELRLFSGRL